MKTRIKLEKFNHYYEEDILGKGYFVLKTKDGKEFNPINPWETPREFILTAKTLYKLKAEYCLDYFPKWIACSNNNFIFAIFNIIIQYHKQFLGNYFYYSNFFILDCYNNCKMNNSGFIMKMFLKLCNFQSECENGKSIESRTNIGHF